MKKYFFDNVIVGSGCAAYNAADILAGAGKETAVVTEGKNIGTSRNAGSDKQTYYKLSVSGNSADSVYAMAEKLFSGGCADGDVAFCEAAGSVECFYKLVSSGVKFPRNEYGEYVGYKTDHDDSVRATSAGPYTSRDMTVALEKSALNNGAKLFDGFTVVKIVVSEGRARGVIAVEKAFADDLGLCFFGCNHLIIATGGPGELYEDTVYPFGQSGALGLLIDAGVNMCNLAEWQYGLSSVKFRWNVSGSYQQVIPRYISVKDGKQREFLSDYTDKNVFDLIFLKGYQWPFDAAKAEESSVIDIAVYSEKQKGARVYLDYTVNPDGFSLSKTGKEARDYLERCGVYGNTPYERLTELNPSAAKLFKEHGIDLEKEPLEIAVSAQHHNGGADVDVNYLTCVNALYVAGEAAGTLGITRPGGSALNACMVGSMRAARHILSLESQPVDTEKMLQQAEADARQIRDFVKKSVGVSTLKQEKSFLRKLMSARFSFLRDEGKMREGLKTVEEKLLNFSLNNKCGQNETAELFKNYYALISARAVCLSMLICATDAGSRGGALVTSDGKVKPEDLSFRDKKLIYSSGKTFYRSVRSLPEPDETFEKVWNRFLREEKQ